MGGDGSSAGKPARLQRIEYIHSMLGQLRLMAEAERCAMLGYLIAMAYMEAGDILKAGRASPVTINEGDPAAGLPVKPARKVKFQ